MARLSVHSHPNRVFKDDTWRWSMLHHGTDGYLSIGDHSDEAVGHGDLWAFAVEELTPGDPFSMFTGVVELERPFVAAEIVEIYGRRWAIGFFPEPID